MIVKPAFDVPLPAAEARALDMCCEMAISSGVHGDGRSNECSCVWARADDVGDDVVEVGWLYYDGKRSHVFRPLIIIACT